MSKLLEFLLGSIVVAVFSVALMFFSVLQYVLRAGGDDCGWYGSATTWIDSNGDGLVNRGESMLANVEIHVDDLGNGRIDTGWPAVTDQDGEARLNVRIPGCSETIFAIYVDVPAGYRLTTRPRIEVNPEPWESQRSGPVYYFGFTSAR